MLVSLITPALNEGANLPRRAAELARQTPPWEWIVVDGGSTDGSAEAACQLDAQVLVTARGRGRQMNAGARASRGEALLFLHADTELPDGALEAVRGALSSGDVVGGNFRLLFGAGALADRIFTRYYALQQRLLGIFYGDSTLFVRRSTFFQVGGYPELPIMEDYELVRVLRRTGALVRLPLAVRTSDRRYRNRVGRALAAWAAILFLHKLGAPAPLVSRLYASRS